MQDQIIYVDADQNYVREAKAIIHRFPEFYQGKYCPEGRPFILGRVRELQDFRIRSQYQVALLAPEKDCPPRGWTPMCNDAYMASIIRYQRICHFVTSFDSIYRRAVAGVYGKHKGLGGCVPEFIQLSMNGYRFKIESFYYHGKSYIGILATPPQRSRMVSIYLSDHFYQLKGKLFKGFCDEVQKHPELQQIKAKVDREFSGKKQAVRALLEGSVGVFGSGAGRVRGAGICDNLICESTFT